MEREENGVVRYSVEMGVYREGKLVFELEQGLGAILMRAEGFMLGAGG